MFFILVYIGKEKYCLGVYLPWFLGKSVGLWWTFSSRQVKGSGRNVMTQTLHAQTLHALIWTTDRCAKDSCTSKQWLQQSSQTLSSTYAERWRSSGTCASSYAHCCPVATQTTSRLLLAGGCNWKYNVPELLHCSAYMYVDSSIREGCCSLCLLVCRNPLFRMHVSLQQLLVSPLYVYVSITDWCCARKVILQWLVSVA